MNAIALTRKAPSARLAQPAAIPVYEDPLDEDDVLDVQVTTSRRGLTRLALVAAETSAHFSREQIGHDPMAWMLAPRQLFGGETALEACLERDHCLRAVLLHGLSIGVDAQPGTIDALLADGPGPERTEEPWPFGGHGMSSGSGGSRRLRLYSATIVIARGGEILQAFHASVAPSAAVVRERIRARFGSAAAAQADIQPGFDPEAPGTLGLVPPAILETLLQSGRRVRWASLAGLDITVEQRLPS